MREWLRSAEKADDTDDPVLSCSRYFFAQMPKGFEDISKMERSTEMKYHAVWKPGGNPRRGMGSMKAGRRQMQARKPYGTIPGKGVENVGHTGKKAA